MELTSRFYSTLRYIGRLFRSPLLLLIRLYWGISIALAGWGKFASLDNFAQFLSTTPFPLPPYTSALLTAGTEFIFGMLLAVGFASRLVSLPLIFVMSMAYLLAHGDGVTSLSSFTSQAPFNFLLGFLIIFAFGPGIFSLDYAIARDKHKI